MSTAREPTSGAEQIRQLLEEAWERFHPSILWWAKRETATCPENAEIVYRGLLSGPREAIPLAARLHEMLRGAEERPGNTRLATAGVVRQNPGDCCDPETSWHFFGTVESPDTGFELHWADTATNKVLAMASRSEPRDGLDVMFWHRNPLSLGALIWAAAGKDLGLTPGTILDELRRNARISPGDLQLLDTVSLTDIQAFGVRFREALRQAEDLIRKLPPETAGHLFLDADGAVIEPDPADPATLQNTLSPSKGRLFPAVNTGPEPGDA
jgi:hypothetical protein